MDIKEIKGIIDLMRKNSLSEFEYEKDGTKIRFLTLGRRDCRNFFRFPLSDFRLSTFR